MEENKVIADCKLVIIGGSAGSLHALMQILPELPQIYSFAIVLVLHRKNTDEETLEELIRLKSTVNVNVVEDKVPLLPGFIYVAPSNYHLLFEKNDTLSLDTSEKVNYSRPSIDVSFESASEVYKQQLVGILLSGSNADGTQGLNMIKSFGGTIVVQDPESAEMPFMPNNAIANCNPDYVLNNQGIIEFITSINNQE
ncbi:chemotaxis protein CheB [Flavobacterium sp. GA093]|uniref:protein-glutamate methylesterase n=1 Tax=Flavobacterium hydrocarbonoxydans TaxID=2683249 RepID=A0A6I4NRX1_9FLAO|nr:chemotaxis protein CheB [Flavobacterium hydrocarbonoxydans]MWB96871.1 chemotaxis protein CheB [Flavobacterium hydrocarbonoxydans]